MPSVTKVKGLYRHIQYLFRVEIRLICINPLLTVVFAHNRQYSVLILQSSYSGQVV